MRSVQIRRMADCVSTIRPAALTSLHPPPRRTVPSGGAMDPGASGPRKFVMELHVNWDRASEDQLKRVLVDAERETRGQREYVDEALQQR